MKTTIFIIFLFLAISSVIAFPAADPDPDHSKPTPAAIRGLPGVGTIQDEGEKAYTGGEGAVQTATSAGGKAVNEATSAVDKAAKGAAVLVAPDTGKWFGATVAIVMLVSGFGVILA